MNALLQVAAELADILDPEPIACISVREQTVNGVYASITIQLRIVDRRLGGMLELAKRLHLTEVEDVFSPYMVNTGRHAIRGHRNGITVEVIG